MPNKKIDFAIGGQALIEGVMMRSPHFITAAVRKKSGAIKIKEFPFASVVKNRKWLDFPPVRGIINLIEMMALGMKAINFSADEYAEDEFSEGKEAPKERSKFAEILFTTASFILSLALAIFLFKFIPLWITEWLRGRFTLIAESYIIFNLIDGLIRIAIFIGYIGFLSIFKTFRRIFEYHGAEHMAVHAYEAGAHLAPERVARENPEHPRCGTSFILVVLIISIIIYSFVPRHPVFAINLAIRIAVLPVIAGIGYEILKWSAKRTNNFLVKILVAPGLLTQKITTKQPDEKQIEVAIAALERALELEKNNHP